jgi:hypothetical protein
MKDARLPNFYGIPTELAEWVIWQMKSTHDPLPTGQ